MAIKKIIFLDIDGVLNGHHFMREAQSCNIVHSCVLQLNRIVRRSDARFVLSSAWRYMIHGKAMTLMGFAYMLRTHGFSGIDRLISLTCPDELCHECAKKSRKGNKWDGSDFCCYRCGAKQNRGGQISKWLRENPGSVDRYVVLDDDDLGITAAGHPFVRTNAKTGLTRGRADAAIKILNA